MGQIIALDMAFSVDSIITAIGIAEHVEIMIAAVVFSIIVMMLTAGAISNFINKNLTTKMLALAFLIMVGAAHVSEGLHFHIDKAYIYVALAFCCAVEGLNMLKRYKTVGKTK